MHTITIPNDTARNQGWAYVNGINFYPVYILEMIYFNGCETTDEKFPADIELEVSFYDNEIDEITYNDKPVTTPKWLEWEIMEMI